MRKNRLKIVAMFALGLLLILLNCESRPIVSDQSDHNYRLDGVVLSNNWNHYDLTVFKLKKDDTTFSNAEIILENDTVYWVIDHYQLIVEDSTLKIGTNDLIIHDGALFADTIPIIVPGEFSISISGLPEDRINPGGASVNLSWTASDFAEGYLLALYHISSDYREYSWVTSGATSTTITPDAFRWSNGIEADTGWYKTMIFSYTGSPDSTILNQMYMLDLPSNLIENLEEPNLTGRVGVLMGSTIDSIHVVAQ